LKGIAKSNVPKNSPGQNRVYLQPDEASYEINDPCYQLPGDYIPRLATDTHSGVYAYQITRERIM
jgi:hypothetical protein